MAYLVSLLCTAGVTALLVPFREQINSTTTALAYLLVVLFVALFWGSRPALVASVEVSWLRREGEADGLSGFETFTDWHPDLVITDVAMPVMDGLEYAMPYHLKH